MKKLQNYSKGKIIMGKFEYVCGKCGQKCTIAYLAKAGKGARWECGVCFYGENASNTLLGVNKEIVAEQWTVELPPAGKE